MTDAHDANHRLPTAQTRSAFFDTGSHLRLWIVATLGLVFDLWSKAWAFDTIGPTESREFIPNVLVFQRSLNPGALFGMGKGMTSVFIGASFFALGFVLFLFISSTKNRRSLHIALGMILAGSLGNLYDRSFVLADQVTNVETQQSYIGLVIEEKSTDRHLTIGTAFDRQAPRTFRRDRIKVTRTPVVRDFLHFTPKFSGRPVWPWVFNIADSLLVAGVILLLINFWFERRMITETSDATPNEDSP